MKLRALKTRFGLAPVLHGLAWPGCGSVGGFGHGYGYAVLGCWFLGLTFD